MSKINTHKDLDVWKNAMGLAKEIYLLTADFPITHHHFSP